LEITESVIMQDVDHSIGSLLAIRALGRHNCHRRLRHPASHRSTTWQKLPVDTLKIDRFFRGNGFQQRAD